MQFLGLNINFARKGSEMVEQKSVSYSTRYANFDGAILDGKNITRNNIQFYKMYRINTDIRRCISEKQQTSMKSGFEFRQYIESTGNEKVVQAPTFMEAMDRSGGITTLKNRIVLNLESFGNAYIRRKYNVRGVMGYEVLDSRHVTVITDSELVPTRYNYQNPGKKGKIETYEAKDIIHVVYDNDLDNPVFGISPLETLVVDVLGDEEANMSNYYFFQNDNIPSALFVLKAGLTAEQQKSVYEQIKESLTGGHNKYKSVASSSIEDVKPIGANHTDANFLEQRKYTTDKVCAALGVPKTILGYIEDANYSNGETQYEKFIENTIRPLENKLEEIFTIMLHDFAEYKKYYFSINDEHIDDLVKRSKLATDNVKAGIWTINEARLYVGYEALENELANEPIVSTSSRLLDDLVNGTDPQTVGTPTEPAPTGKAIAQ